MVDNKNVYVILAIIFIVVAFYFVPKLSLFSVIPYTSQCELSNCPAGYTDIGATCDDSSKVCTRNCQKIVVPSCGDYGSESEAKTKVVNSPNQNRVWYWTADYSTESQYCYKYKTYTSWSLTGANDDSKTLKVSTKDGNTYEASKTTTSTDPTVSVTSPYEVQMNDDSDISAAGRVSGSEALSFYETSTLTVKLFVSRANYNPGGTFNSQATCTYQTCSEGQIVIIGDQYKICHNQVFQLVTDIVILTPEEQAAVAAQINNLNATVQEKAQLIEQLTTTIDGQITMINQLNLATAEKAIIIKQLSDNITYQAQLIDGLKLTSAQQLETIQALNLNIVEQGQIINNLQINLDNKIFLISQLQVENANQAALISQMNLSFQNQAYIINQLSANISDDAELIKNLNLNIADQSQLIKDLELQKDELSTLVNALQLSNQDTATLLNNLQLTVDDQIIIINNLNKSLADEQDIVNRLTLTIEQQNKIINDLKNNIIPEEYDIRNIWDQYQIFIIAGAVLIFILIISGGKKR